MAALEKQRLHVSAKSVWVGRCKEMRQELPDSKELAAEHKRGELAASELKVLHPELTAGESARELEARYR